MQHGSSPTPAASRDASHSHHRYADLQPSRWTPALLQAFFDQAPFYAGVLSPDGKVVEAGRLALEACGYSREEVMDRYFWDAGWWRGSKEAQQRLQGALAGCHRGERFQAVLPYLMADGSERWVDFSMSPVMEANRLAFVIALGTDITDRVLAEEELTLVRKRLDSALLAAEIGTYEWDVLADRLIGDRNLERLFEIEGDLSGAASLQAYLEAIHPDDRGVAESRVRHSVATGENFEMDYRIVLRGDRQRWVTSRGRMLKDEHGRVVNFFGMVMDISHRKKAEQERETIAARFRRLTAIHETVLSSTNDFAYVFDLEGRFLYANRPLLTVYGRSLEDVVGKSFNQLGYPQWHAEMHLREIAQVIATRQPIQGEVPFRGESGISGIYDYIFTPVFGADGRVEAVAGTTRDVTERKRGEARDRLLVALDDAMRPLSDPQAITMAAAQLLGEYLGANRCAYADVEDDGNTFNLTGNFNRDVPSIVGRYRFDQFGDECLRLMRAGEPYVVADSETDPRTGQVREAYRATLIRSVICVPLHKAGRFVAAMAVHQKTVRTWLQTDIEAVLLVASRSWESIERTRVVRVLAESEQRLRLAVATGRLGVWEVEFPSRTLTCSDHCKTIYGRAPGSNFSFEDMVLALHPDDRSRVMEAFERAASQGTEYDLEHRTVRPDGDIRWVLVRAQARLEPEGATRRMVGVSLDITARKEAEREQVRLREEAVRASRAKDDFLATLSHELRTPLNPVLLVASEAALRTDLDAETQDAFETIRRNVEIEARLIDDLLDLTAISRGKLAIRQEVHDLHEIVPRAVEAVRSEFEQKKLKVSVTLSPGRAVVFVDEVRLLQVLINLLKNAAKFTPARGDIAVQTFLRDHSTIEVRVQDSGIGMTAPELARAFEAFEQGDHALDNGAHRYGGLGLGLAIARRLVELQGGQLDAASEGRDRGTLFTASLPLHRESQPVPAPPRHPPAAPPAHVAAAGARILLVEDHEATRHTLERLLVRRRYHVITAASVAEARRRAGEHVFDLVISDVGLPDGDGASLMAELRDRHQLRGIALTGYGMEEDVERCSTAGFVAHLTKPIRIESLEAALHASFAVARPL